MTVPTAAEQAEIAQNLRQKALSLGDVWCVVNGHWWQMFVEFSGYKDPGQDGGSGAGVEPGPIENEDLLADDSDADDPKLKMGLVSPQHYVVVPKELWVKLVEWYTGGPEIARKVASSGVASKRVFVDLYPITLHFTKVGAGTRFAGGPVHDFTLSRTMSVKALKYRVGPKFDTAPHNIRFWVHSHYDDDDDNDFRLITTDEEKLAIQDLGLADHAYLLIDTKSHDGVWSRDKELVNTEIVPYSGGTEGPKWISSGIGAGGGGISGSGSGRTTRTGIYNYRSSMYGNERGAPVQKGVTGLQNLGNTCFMNSALQCLSNTPPLTQYFLNGDYRHDLNPTNPLGMEGKLAEEYAGLVRDLWSNDYMSVAPTKFKGVLGRFAPQFSGFQQQDSQELVAFLLDGLHEDLNRVKDKPATENVEGDGRPDAEVAAEAWDIHLLRNQSVIVDLFQGQFKSTVTCPIEECDRVSITFDPLMYLSLPLPAKTATVINVRLTFLDADRPATRYSISVPKSASVKDIKTELAELAGLPPTRIVMADVYSSKIYTTLPDWKPVRHLQEERGLNAYEVKEEVTETRRNPASFSVTGARRPLIQFSSDTEEDDDKKSGDEATNEVDDGPVPSGAQPGGPGAAPPKAEPKSENVSLVQVLQRAIVTDTRGIWANKPRPALIGTPFLLSVNKDTYTNDMLREEILNYVDANLASKPVDRDNLPFDLVCVGQTGVTCAFCPYQSQCKGCSFPPEADGGDNLSAISLDDRKSIALHWSEEGLEEYYDEEKAKALVDDPSVEDNEEASMKIIPLSACFELFCKEEVLGEEDMWYCNKCQEFRQASKKFDLWRLPNILVIHLKRFQYSNVFREKIDAVVDYPIEGLDMSPFVLSDQGDEPLLYDLIGVSLHSGGLGGGHYTAYAKNQEDGKWYYFNDSRCSETTIENVVQSREAYLLFYQARDFVGAVPGADGGAGAGDA